MPKEIWYPIPLLPGYLLSNLLRIKKIKTTHSRERIIKLQTNIKGYVWLNTTRQIHKNYLLHRLVASVFLGSCPSGKQVNHKNGIKSDNRPENLEYVTAAENIQHSFKILHREPTRHLGESHPHAKITNELAIKILSAPRFYGSGRWLSRTLNIPEHIVYKVRGRKTWRHITVPLREDSEQFSSSPPRSAELVDYESRILPPRSSSQHPIRIADSPPKYRRESQDRTVRHCRDRWR